MVLCDCRCGGEGRGGEGIDVLNNLDRSAYSALRRDCLKGACGNSFSVHALLSTSNLTALTDSDPGGETISELS